MLFIEIRSLINKQSRNPMQQNMAPLARVLAKRVLKIGNKGRDGVHLISPQRMVHNP